MTVENDSGQIDGKSLTELEFEVSQTRYSIRKPSGEIDPEAVEAMRKASCLADEANPLIAFLIISALKNTTEI